MIRDRTGTGLTTERRVQLIECEAGRLWDQVWWISLPCWRRWWYRLQGFGNPIQRFFDEVEDEIAAKQAKQKEDANQCQP